jgi:hypothetical protein
MTPPLTRTDSAAGAPILTRVVRMDPRRLKLLDLNARYMRHEVFMRLVENVRRDGGLTSLPFAWRLHDDETRQPVMGEDGEAVYEVLSGNHRVKAAVAADLAEIDVLVTDAYLPPDRRRAIQLSHNALVGEDDPATLKTIYGAIGDFDLRLYSGLDDKTLKLLDQVKAAPMSEAALTFQTIALTFLPHEVDQVNAAWEMARKAASGSKAFWLTRWGDYDRCLDALEAASQSYGVKNTATALMLVLEVFTRHLDELTEGYLDSLGEPVENARRVPLATVLGEGTIPAQAAAKLKKVVDRMAGRGEIDPAKRWQALERLADGYLVDGAAEPKN